MTKFDTRVMEVVRPEIHQLQQQILDQEAAPSSVSDEDIHKLGELSADLKVEMVAYFGKILSDLSEIKKKDKPKKEKKPEERRLREESTASLMHTVIRELDTTGAQHISQSPSFGRRLRNWIQQRLPINRTMLQWDDILYDLSPDDEQLAMRYLTLWIDEHARGADENTQKLLSALFGDNVPDKGYLPVMQRKIIKEINHNESKIDTCSEKLDQLIQDNCCSDLTQLVENVVLPAIYNIGGGNSNLVNQLTVIKAQLLDLRRLLQ